MKDLFKTLIADFHKSLPVKNVLPRELKLPIRSSKIISLIGPRRSGKTFYFFQMINQLLAEIPPPQIIYFNFEDERLDLTTAHFQLMIDAYYELYPDNFGKEIFFFFDEIQEIAGWEKFVRRIYDTISKHIFITGSSAKMLGKDIATHLRGRHLVYQLFPLSFREFCQFQGIDTAEQHSTTGKNRLKLNLTNYLRTGGFPELLSLSPELVHPTLQTYFEVMIFRDIVERYRISNVPALKYFVKRMFNTVSSEFSIRKVFNELKSQGYKIGKDKLYEYLDYVTDGFLFFVLFPYKRSLTQQQMSNKKVYTIDTGLLNAVTFRFSGDLGKLLENAVYIQLQREGNETLYLKNNFECDFLVKEQDKINQAIQVTYSISDPLTRKREVESLLKAMEHLQLNTGLILTFDETEEIRAGDRNIIVMPAWKWFLR